MTSFSSPAPPPYSPMRTHFPSYTRSSIPRVNRRGGRRTKSESCVPRDNNIGDDDFLANLAAIQLLTGCTIIPCRHLVSGNLRSIDICSDDDGPPDLTLHVFCTLRVPVRHRTRSITRPRVHRFGLRATLRNGVDGHISYPSDESARRFAKTYSAPMTPSSSHDQVSSQELDRRLRSIDEALHQSSSRRGSRRLNTSEVVWGGNNRKPTRTILSSTR